MHIENLQKLECPKPPKNSANFLDLLIFNDPQRIKQIFRKSGNMNHPCLQFPIELKLYSFDVEKLDSKTCPKIFKIDQFLYSSSRELNILKIFWDACTHSSSSELRTILPNSVGQKNLGDEIKIQHARWPSRFCLITKKVS